MEISTGKNNGVGTLFMKGRFDFNIHRVFREAYDPLLQDSGINTIDIDLSGVEYMDSSALGMLLMLRERANNSNKQIRLSKPNATVKQILDIANFGKLFSIN